MRITKFGHACVRIEHDGVALWFDPGMFTEPEAVDGATAVLVTHLHPDHCTPINLRATDAPVFTVAGSRTRSATEAPDVAERITVVAPGGGVRRRLPVTAVGECTTSSILSCRGRYNSGYLVTFADQRVYHPGDALTVPEVPVDVLLCPSSAPWLRSEMAIEFVRAVGAPRNLAIHDRDLLRGWRTGSCRPRWRPWSVRAARSGSGSRTAPISDAGTHDAVRAAAGSGAEERFDVVAEVDDFGDDRSRGNHQVDHGYAPYVASPRQLQTQSTSAPMLCGRSSTTAARVTPSTQEPLAALLRPGNAGSNTAATAHAGPVRLRSRGTRRARLVGRRNAQTRE